MAAIDYATTVSSLNTAIGTATGADLELLTDIRDRLSALGASLTRRFTSEVSDAKDVWGPAAEAAHDEAAEAVGYVYTAEGETPPTPPTFAVYTIAEVLTQLGDAGRLTESAFLKRILQTHRSALGSAFSVGPDDAYKYTSRPRRIDHVAGVGPNSPSVAELEREIYGVIAEATQALALAAY